jgi:hypothetical protein
MTRHRLLTKDELLQCFAEPMRDMTAAPEAAADIWPYVDGLDLSRLGITNIGDVAQVYRDGRLRYDQVLLRTDITNVFLVIVVDLSAEAVLGHHLLDLNIEYGLARPH